MKIFKNTSLRMITALMVVGVISGIVLVFVYRYAVPRIEINVKNETSKAIKNIFPDAAQVDDTGGGKIFTVKDKAGKSLGYAFLGEGNGYQGTIKLLAGISEDLSAMKGMEVLESQETPGLGAEISTDKFRSQFKGLSLSHEIEYVKNKKPEKPFEIEAITGATISSRAVVKILNKGISDIKEFLRGKR